MKLPPNMTEEEVTGVIYEVVNTLARKFRFGYHSIEDMKQEGARFAIEALNSGKYDATRPLANFLYIHVKNRLINYKRDNYIRNEPPCKSCIFFDPKYKKSKNQCAAFDNKLDCKKLSDWTLRNNMKYNLMSPTHEHEYDSEECVESKSFENASFNEIKDLIDLHLSADLRTDYLRMLDGVSIPKGRRQKIREAVLEILKSNVHES